MKQDDRYEILESIASGDYATVYRGVDHELQREVAIKQIHEQYLADPRQLDRYWQEAHLLATLQHPHIMTIYDIVRERGWLILELMQGSLSQLLAGRPIDLKDLRLTLVHTVQALQSMHQHGIVHGDVKPSNLLIDRHSRIKLGDFGIARRAAGEGSVVKGTTKYMAPEVVSDQFGPAGPHSDIYSLGFTAYELMCGEHFESLFPGLNMYGRDRQIAWMMWHSAPDRRLPEISRVLDGVPPDLARVVEKMCEKDPSRRYRSTDELLADLKADTPPATPPPSPPATEPAKAEPNRRRPLVIAAAVCSLVLTIGMLFLPTGGEPDRPKQDTPKLPSAGEIVMVDRDQGRIFVQAGEGDAQPVSLRDGVDRIFLNGQQSKLSDLDRRDQVQIATSSMGDRPFLIVEATRDADQLTQGTVTAVDAGAGVVVVANQQENEGSAEYLVSPQAAIEINGQFALSGRPLVVADVRAGDQIRLRYKVRDDQRREAATLHIQRTLRANGWLVAVEGQKVQVRPGESSTDSAANDLTLTLAADCTITLNGQSEYQGQPIGASSLRPRDKVAVTFDATVHRIEAFRQVQLEGVVAAVDSSQRSLAAQGAGGEIEQFLVADGTSIQIVGTNLEMPLDSLRKGDRVTVRRKSPDPAIRDAAQVLVSPQEDAQRWVFIVDQSEYAQASVPKVAAVSEDAESLHMSLRYAYRVPEKQAVMERHLTLEKLRSSLAGFVKRVPAEGDLIVYFGGLGFLTSDNQPLLAGADFDPEKPAETGLPLRWLVDQLELCPARHKLLILRTGGPTEMPAPAGYQDPLTLAESLRPRATRPISATVDILVSCSDKEANVLSGDGENSVFGQALAAAYTGRADGNRDQRVDSEELADFVKTDSQQRLTSVAGVTVTPRLLRADPAPPRLSEEAIHSVSRILQLVARPNPEMAAFEYEEARQLCNQQPDADLAAALILMKQDKTPLALEVLEKIMKDHPQSPVAYEAAAWIHARRGDFQQSVSLLNKLVEQLPESPVAAVAEYQRHAAAFAGRIAAFALAIAPAERRVSREQLAELQTTLQEKSAALHAVFIEGGRAVRQQTEELDRQLSESANASEKSRLEMQRTNFNYYLPFDYPAVQKYLLARLEM